MRGGFIHTIRVYSPWWYTRVLQALGLDPPLTPFFFCLRDEETVRNLLPEEGRNHFLNVVLKGGAQVPTWYTGIFEGNHTPIDADTMATLPGSAVECVSYAETTRPQWVPGSVLTGQVDNSASVATFTMNNTTAKTLYGDFISSSPTKGGVTGTLLSVARYATPKVVTAGDVWTVTASIQLIST